MKPLGTDKLGNAYRYHFDAKEAEIKVYKDDPDEETWELAAETEEELKELIQQLKDGDTFVPKAAAAAKADHEGDLPMEEDSLDYSGILRDTRPSNVPSNITS